MLYITDQSHFLYGMNQLNRATSKGELKNNYSKTSFNVSRGRIRANLYSKEWNNASLSKAIKKFAPNAEGLSTAKGKTIYHNSDTGIQVVYDVDDKYFRVENKNLTGKRSYLDMTGNVPNNKTTDGKTMGRNQQEYNQVTHFNNTD